PHEDVWLDAAPDERSHGPGLDSTEVPTPRKCECHRHRQPPLHRWMRDADTLDRSGGILSEDRFDLDMQGDLLAQHHGVVGTGDRSVVADPEVCAIDLGLGTESGPCPTEWIWPEAIPLNLQRDGLGHTANGEIPIDEEVIGGRAH